MNRIGWLVLVFLLSAIVAVSSNAAEKPTAPPNILFVFADQWRAQAFSYAGDPNVQTPNIDRLARESINFTNAISGCPVCCPYRGSLMTGQRPITHGVFMNDVQLPAKATTIAEVLADTGYDTGYIGKWHLDGRGRSSYIPPERRQGFDYWKALECTHNYGNSFYYDGNDSTKRTWKGYDAVAQTRDAQHYLAGRSASDKPFVLFLSWGPPHAPYHTAPARFKRDASEIELRPNVPEKMADQVRRDLAGYYAHCAALDELIGQLQVTLTENGLAENTILVFTSDHGDMLGSHGAYKKQRPFDESLRVPLLVRFPRMFGKQGRQLDALINSEDIMPTLLSLCDVPIPPNVEGLDFRPYMLGGDNPNNGAALFTCVAPFGQWTRRQGGRESRGIRTARYTFVRDLDGPWLLFDNQTDPYQMDNLCGKPEHATLQARLNAVLTRKLKQTNDEFLPGSVYLERWGYEIDATGTVPYKN